MDAACRRGFSLIELLTVIAIIAILAGLTAATLPRVLERARISDVESDFVNLRTGLASHYADRGTYPLAYGFRTWASRLAKDAGETGWDDTSDSDMFNFVPYMSSIGQYGAVALYDRFAERLDTDKNDFISRLEYSPLKPFDGPLFGGGPLGPGMEGPQRPYVYAPVNLENFKRLQAAIGTGNLWDGKTWPAAASNLNLVSPRYDAFVLISVGPEGSTAGLAAPSDEAAFVASLPIEEDAYQALALRTYYLATRDANQNNIPDFDYRARTRQDEAGALVAYFGNLEGHALPDGSFTGGPLIFHQGG